MNSGRTPDESDDDHGRHCDAEGHPAVGDGVPDRTELIPRPAPEGMSRKDRKLWRVLEAERIAAAVNRSRPSDGYRAIRPGKIARRTRFGLGRRGRKTFRDADFAYRSDRWERQQASADMDTKARGVLVLTVILLAFLVWRLVPGGGNDENASAPTSSAASTAPAVATSASSRISTSTTASPSSAESAAQSAPLAPTTQSSESRSSSSTSRASESAVFGNGTNTVAPSSPAGGGAAPTAPGVVSASTLSSAPSIPAAPTGAVPASVRGSAVGTAKAWFERTCGSSWQQPYGAAITASKSLMTNRGWAYANPAADTAGQRWWTNVLQRKETRQCTRIVVKRFDGPGPSGPTVTTLIFQADRVVTSDFPDVPAQLEKVSELRTLTRGTDDLWRIGAPELAG